ncbi:DUF7793 family protein [Winogradskyella psychrotolerans]|uniref:DUF7793 family protein n=1 Tax=Winogradskyella psychrotolerans TaxID=1344585 RepID=UPI001C06FCFA|nr:hypothetical protein [Winogradskyella psychrotolerans]MBU2928293.1 hypothetical protein [Winogradskyella psychrotolerans]
MSKIIGFNNAIFWTDHTGILYCEFNNEDPNFKLELKNVELYIKAIITLCDGNAMPFLIDLKNTRGTFSVSAAKLLAQNPELIKLRISESYVINSLGGKLLLSFYKRLYDDATPFAIFEDIILAEEYALQTKYKFHRTNNLQLQA